MSGTDTYIDGYNNELSRYYHMLMHFMYETSFSNGERSKSHFGALRASPTMMQSYAISVGMQQVEQSYEDIRSTFR